METTFKEALDWILQLKEKIDAFCQICPDLCELCQDILTYPCFWEDLIQGVKAVMLFNDYKNGKLTKNEFRKSLCKFTSCSTGCHIGYYAGANLGKYYIKNNFDSHLYGIKQCLTYLYWYNESLINFIEASELYIT